MSSKANSKPRMLSLFESNSGKHSGIALMHRGYLLFFKVNTKYISSNVMKISVNSLVRSTSEFSDIFNT